MQNTHADIIQVIHDYMSDPATDWRIGEQAVFTRGTDEEAEITLDYAGGLIIAGAGAVRIAATAMTRLVPAEGLEDDLWVQAGLLCLRDGDAGMANRSVLTELGNDMMAAQPIGRLGTLFDLGVNDPNVDLCLRTADESLCSLLRARKGAAIANDDVELRDAIEETGVDYVAMTRLGRIENFGGRTPPQKPFTLDPPSGYKTCLAFVPPQPSQDGEFDEATFGAFRVLHGIFADPALVRLKQSVQEALRGGEAPETITAENAEARMAVAVLLRQLAAREGPSDNLNRWRAAFDC